MVRIGGNVTLKTPRGDATVELFPPTLLLTTFYRHLGLHLVTQVVRELDRHAQSPGGVDLFVDAAGMTGYDSEARLAMTEWVLANRPSIGAMHVLVLSKLGTMGAAVANLALGGLMRVYSNPTAFQRALELAGGRAPGKATAGGRGL